MNSREFTKMAEGDFLQGIPGENRGLQELGKEYLRKGRAWPDKYGNSAS